MCMDYFTSSHTNNATKPGCHMIAVGDVHSHRSIRNHQDVLSQGYVANATVGPSPIGLELEVVAIVKGPRSQSSIN